MASDERSDRESDGLAGGKSSRPGLQSSTPQDDATKGIDEALISRVLLERKLLTSEQMQACLDEQSQTRIDGAELTLAQILVRREWIKVDHLIKII